VVRDIKVYRLDMALKVAETRLNQSCMQYHSQMTYQAVSDARRPSMSGTCVTRQVRARTTIFALARVPPVALMPPPPLPQ
jgi:hypothetical protein